MALPKLLKADWKNLKPGEKNPYARIPGHPSHTAPGTPEGPDWWRRKGGWDRFAANLFEQTKDLGKIVELLEYTCDVREMNFAKGADRVIARIRSIKTGYKQIRALAGSMKVRHAELLAHIRPVEDAMKRGQLALSAEEWERLRKEARQQAEMRPAKVKPSRHKGREPIVHP